MIFSITYFLKICLFWEEEILWARWARWASLIIYIVERQTQNIMNARNSNNIFRQIFWHRRSIGGFGEGDVPTNVGTGIAARASPEPGGVPGCASPGRRISFMRPKRSKRVSRSFCDQTFKKDSRSFLRPKRSKNSLTFIFASKAFPKVTPINSDFTTTFRFWYHSVQW